MQRELARIGKKKAAALGTITFRRSGFPAIREATSSAETPASSLGAAEILPSLRHRPRVRITVRVNNCIAGAHRSRRYRARSRNSMSFFHFERRTQPFIGFLSPVPSQLTISLLTISSLTMASNSSQSTHCPFVLISTMDAFHRCLGISATIDASCL